MRLRKPCEHGRYETHGYTHLDTNRQCPGGEFVVATTGLTVDMIEKALATPDRKWSRGTIMDAAAAYSRILADG